MSSHFDSSPEMNWTLRSGEILPEQAEKTMTDEKLYKAPTGSNQRSAAPWRRRIALADTAPTVPPDAETLPWRRRNAATASKPSAPSQPSTSPWNKTDNSPIQYSSSPWNKNVDPMSPSESSRTSGLARSGLKCLATPFQEDARPRLQLEIPNESAGGSQVSNLPPMTTHGNVHGSTGRAADAEVPQQEVRPALAEVPISENEEPNNESKFTLRGSAPEFSPIRASGEIQNEVSGPANYSQYPRAESPVPMLRASPTIQGIRGSPYITFVSSPAVQAFQANSPSSIAGTAQTHTMSCELGFPQTGAFSPFSQAPHEAEATLASPYQISSPVVRASPWNSPSLDTRTLRPLSASREGRISPFADQTPVIDSPRIASRHQFPIDTPPVSAGGSQQTANPARRSPVNPLGFLGRRPAQFNRGRGSFHPAGHNVGRGSHTSSKTWVHPRTTEQARWAEVYKNLKDMSLIKEVKPNPAVTSKKVEDSFCVPKTFNQWIEHRIGFEQDRMKEKKKMIARKQHQYLTPRHPDLPMPGPTAEIYIAPFGGKQFNDSCSPVLAMPSMWSPWYKHTEEHPEALWPCAEEMKEEGNERMTSGFRRFLALPRVPGNNTVVWKQKKVLEQLPFDEVWKQPSAETYHAAREAAGPEEMEEMEALIGEDLLKAIDCGISDNL